MTRRVGCSPLRDYTPVGIGCLGQRFKCMRCQGHKGLLGRRKQLVRGVREWVCAGCVLPVIEQVAA